VKTVAIVQARMGSSRLPGKVLANLCGQPMLAVLLHRLSLAIGLDEIVVATTNAQTDNVLVDWLISNNVAFFRGSESDVLERFWSCAKKYKAELVVRITADDPLKDPKIVTKAIDEFKSRINVDYVSNTIHPTYPEGLDVEVFSFSALDLAYRESRLISEREHVTPYIWKNPDKFGLYCFKMKPDLSHWRWTVDKPEDLIFIKKVLALLNNNIDVGYEEIIDLIQRNPELARINSNTVRNEGYLNTISKENKK